MPLKQIRDTDLNVTKSGYVPAANDDAYSRRRRSAKKPTNIPTLEEPNKSVEQTKPSRLLASKKHKQKKLEQFDDLALRMALDSVKNQAKQKPATRKQQEKEGLVDGVTKKSKPQATKPEAKDRKVSDKPANPPPEAKSALDLDIDAQIYENKLPDQLFVSKNRFSQVESRIALSAFAFIIFVLGATWFGWDNDYAIVGDEDSAYNYGLVGGLMMLVILIYALRKRLGFLRKMGDIKYWYYFHFVFGIVGPVLIILHTSFNIQSINGGVALFAMLSIVFSGFVGRYIYTRVGYGLESQAGIVEEINKQLDKGVLKSKVPTLQHIERKIKAHTMRTLKPPATFFQTLSRLMTIKQQSKSFARAVEKEIKRVVKPIAKQERWDKSLIKKTVGVERRYVQQYLDMVVSVGKFRAYEKLGARWRLFHVPILYVLVLSTAAHVVSVHMY